MEETYNSDPDDVIDQHELEVALYSQVHFDPGPGSESWNKDILIPNNHRSFHIEVKNLTARLVPLKPSIPLLAGDFIGFSETPDDRSKQQPQNVEVSPSATHSKHQHSKLKSSKTKGDQDYTLSFQIDKKGSKESKEDSSSMDNLSVNKETEKKTLTINKKKCLPVKLPKSCNGGDSQVGLINKTDSVKATNEDGVGETAKTLKQKKRAQISSGDGHSQERPTGQTSAVADKCLPFKLTKTKKVVSEELSEPNVSLKKSQSDTSFHNTGKQIQNLPKLQDFLHLSKSDSNFTASKVKKKVSKLDAAVQIRKPPVCLRRPPFVAKFKPDSDTDTDYSDSECSVRESPAKPQAKKSARTLTKMSSEAPAKTLFGKQGTEDASSKVQSTGERLDPDIQTEEDEGEDGCIEESDDCILVEEGAASEDVSTIELSEETSSEESEDETDEATDHSEGEVTSSEDDSPLEVTPNLEFNLAGGMSALLSSKSPNAEEWKIDEKDRFKTNSITSRYFSPLKVQCRNCRVEGHLSRDCPKPMKKKCVFCAEEGHLSQACPDAICYNCDSPGHRNTDCPEPKRNWRVSCNRCSVAGHREEMCPDRWRQYHITTDPKHLNTQPKNATNKRVYCYNCGQQGHFGHDCRATRFNRFVPASYPFIARYDTSKKRMKSIDAGSRHDKNDSEHRVKRKHKRSEADKDSSKKKKRSKANKKDEVEKSSDFLVPGSKVPKKSKSQSSFQSQTFSKGHHKKQISPASVNSRKRHHETYEHEDEAGDLQEDFESHQVNHNEWWHSQDKQPLRKRKKIDGNQEDQYFREQQWDGRRNRTDERKHFSRTQEDQGQGDFWGKNYMQMNQYGPRRPANAQYLRGNAGRNSLLESFQQNYPGSHNNQGFRQGHQPNRGFRQGNHPNQGFRQCNPSSQGGMKHCQSWPVMQTKNTGGFQFQNDQFAMMKNNCDRNQYPKNW